MRQIDLREGARRQHRSVALFAAIQCWLRNLDGIVLDRSDLERLLGLSRFKGTRVEWLEEDLAEYFQYHKLYWYSGSSLASIFISRAPLDGYLSEGRMTDEKRIKNIPVHGPRIGSLKTWKKQVRRSADPAVISAVPFLFNAANIDESILSSYLSLLAQGQIAPSALPALRNSAAAAAPLG